MLEVNGGYCCSLSGTACVKEPVSDTCRLLILLTPVQLFVYWTQVCRFFFTITDRIFTAVSGWLIHTIHSPYNKHYFYLSFYYFCNERIG